MTDYLTKPFSPRALLEAIVRHCGCLPDQTLPKNAAKSRPTVEIVGA